MRPLCAAIGAIVALLSIAAQLDAARPYPIARWGAPPRSDRAAPFSMNETFPLAPGGRHEPPALTHEPVTVVVNGTAFSGQLLVVANPTGHVTIFPPLAGCGSVEETTVNAAARGCTAATNAGFFNMVTGGCIGNVVSNGKVLQLSSALNAHFGVLADGETYFVGYVEDLAAVSAGAFSQLVTGVGWLVRDGRSFVAESVAIEQPAATFVNESAPRLVVGYGATGELMVLAIYGFEAADPEYGVGPSLYEMADVAVALGFAQAINLDGGASDTVVVDGELCSSCGMANLPCSQTRTRPGAASANAQQPLPRAAASPPSPPSPVLPYNQCGCCGIDLAASREQGVPAPPPAPLVCNFTATSTSHSTSSHVQLELCQRPVTTILCIL